MWTTVWITTKVNGMWISRWFRVYPKASFPRQIFVIKKPGFRTEIHVLLAWKSTWVLRGKHPIQCNRNPLRSLYGTYFSNVNLAIRNVENSARNKWHVTYSAQSPPEIHNLMVLIYIRIHSEKKSTLRISAADTQQIFPYRKIHCVNNPLDYLQ